MATSKLVSIKLMIVSNANRVLFAEAGKDFVDFLFHFLSLPVGTLFRINTADKMVGCLGNLYKSVENIEGSYMLSADSKDKILKPRVLNQARNAPLLPPFIYASGPEHKRLFGCCNCSTYVSGEKISCTGCARIMDRERIYVERPVNELNWGFVKRDNVTYMILDDLTVSPSSASSILGLLGQVNPSDVCTLRQDTVDLRNARDVSTVQVKTVDLGIEEGVELLKASMHSKTVLTDVFLKGNPATAKPNSV